MNKSSLLFEASQSVEASQSLDFMTLIFNHIQLASGQHLDFHHAQSSTLILHSIINVKYMLAAIGNLPHPSSVETLLFDGETH